MDQPEFSEFAWAIGLFEGEGCIDLVSSPHGRRNAYARVRLTTTDHDVALRYHAIVRTGRVGGPYPKPNGNKPQYVWELAGHGAVQFIHRVLPHLGARRRAKAIEVLTASGALVDEAQEAFVV